MCRAGRGSRKKEGCEICRNARNDTFYDQSSGIFLFCGFCLLDVLLIGLAHPIWDWVHIDVLLLGFDSALSQPYRSHDVCMRFMRHVVVEAKAVESWDQGFNSEPKARRLHDRR